MSRSFPIVLLLAAGCWGGTMKPGESCIKCHNGDDGPRFGIAGTVYPSRIAGDDDGVAGVIVSVTDSKGSKVTMTSNEAGNFYTEKTLAAPLQVTLSRPGASPVTSSAPGGDCNSCHAAGSRLSFP